MMQVWRLTLPCAFGRRAFWHAPTHAVGWLGRDHCEACAAASSHGIMRQRLRKTEPKSDAPA